jgi:hypothetical protein
MANIAPPMLLKRSKQIAAQNISYIPAFKQGEHLLVKP